MVRKIIGLIRRSDVINIYVIRRAKETQQLHETFIIDFEVRWNTTYDMLERFFEFKILIDEITHNPVVIDGLFQASLQSKLKSCIFSQTDWLLVETSIKMLKPFKRVTDMLQGQKYETLALSKASEVILYHYFENFDHELGLESDVAIKILEHLTKHLVSKISKQQQEATLVNISSLNSITVF